MTEFVAQVRAALDRRRPGRYLCVRIPLQLSAHPALGLDVERLYAAGVDMFNLSGWFHTTQLTDTAKVRELLPDAAIYLEMTHSTGWHPYFIVPGLYGTNGDPRTIDQQFYTTALIAHRRGADGLSLFNFVYYRMGSKPAIPVMEPPFHVLPRLNDMPFLTGQPRHHMLGGTSYYRQVPCDLAPQGSVKFDMDMTVPDETRAAGAAKGRLRIHVEKPLSSDQVITAHFNDTRLDPSPDESPLFENSFDAMISPPGHRCAWILPAAPQMTGNTSALFFLFTTPIFQYTDRP